MNAQTLAALKDSIAHWERMSRGELFVDKPNARQCALCAIYLDIYDNRCCIDCPVYEKTGQKFCKGSPYPEANDLYCDWNELEDNNPNKPAALEAFKSAALVEVEFLKSLLPQEEK